MTHYSLWSLIKGGLSAQRNWTPAWRDAEPKPNYDIIVIGGGGHGLATAYYLAAKHGLRNIAVLEKDWIGGGNTGRNTTVIRSNYFFPQSALFYDYSVKLYEDLSRELNYNIMFSQRGMWTLAHDRHGVEMLRRSANAMRQNGIDADYHERGDVLRQIPGLNPNGRFPVLAAVCQPRGGTARHDAVAWGYARAANSLGVDIIQNCQMLDFVRDHGQIVGVETSRGRIGCSRIGVAVAGHSSEIARMAGFRLPIVSYALQAFVSEPMKPVLDTVLLSTATGVYVSQSDKGELVLGSALDLFPSHAQRGSLPVMEAAAGGLLDLFPHFGRVRFLRQWAGIVDVTHDSTPILGPSPIENLYLDCGWGTGGFKAIPAAGACFAHLLATGASHPLASGFGLERFATGALIDEAAGSGIAH